MIVLTLPQLAAASKLDPKRLVRWADSGKITYYRDRGRYYFPLYGVEHLIKDRSVRRSIRLARGRRLLNELVLNAFQIRCMPSHSA